MRATSTSSLTFGLVAAATALTLTTVFVSRPAAQAVDAAALYKKHCVICHGATGTSPLPNAAFADGVWKHGSSVDEVKKTIVEGVKGTVMQPFAAKLKPEEIDALAKHVRAFDKKLK